MLDLKLGTTQIAVLVVAGACCVAFSVTNGVYVKRLSECKTAADCKKDGQITLAMTCLLAFLIIGLTLSGRYIF